MTYVLQFPEGDYLSYRPGCKDRFVAWDKDMCITFRSKKAAQKFLDDLAKNKQVWNDIFDVTELKIVLKNPPPLSVKLIKEFK